MGDERMTQSMIAEAAEALEGKEPQAALAWAFEHFDRGEIALACSFGAEDVALVDMVAQIRPMSRVFYLDTDLLFDETYAVIDRIRERYDLAFERISPRMTLAEQAAERGDELWAKDPDGCCGIRKVEPLKRVLSSLNAWITGIRRDQAPTRANAKMVEWDAKFGLVKINPLVAWTDKDVWNYIMAHEVPYNKLHDQGYPSIGCIHCTRPVKPGEDPRAGRWSGFTKTECGLHK